MFLFITLKLCFWITVRKLDLIVLFVIRCIIIAIRLIILFYVIFLILFIIIVRLMLHFIHYRISFYGLFFYLFICILCNLYMVKFNKDDYPNLTTNF
jgi:hypothetical protein